MITRRFASLSRVILVTASVVVVAAPSARAELGVDWEQMGRWSPRTDYAMLSFDDHLWVAAGSYDDLLYSDVWRSVDGETWRQVTPSAAFGARRGCAHTVFNDRMWLLAGRPNDEPYGHLNDVWSSEDGVTWTTATTDAGFSPRYGASAFVFDGSMWFLGGSSIGDVWRSDDGSSWSQVLEDPPFGSRTGLATVVHQGRMWVIGGLAGTYYLNDVWWSEDGVNWTAATHFAPFAPRTGHSAFVRDGAIWVAGGWGVADRFRDIWRSDDGATWTLVAESPASCPTVGKMAVNGDRIFQTGGQRYIENLESPLPVAEVWSTTDCLKWEQATSPSVSPSYSSTDIASFMGRLWSIGGWVVHIRLGVWKTDCDIYAWQDADLGWELQADNPYLPMFPLSARTAVHRGQLWALDNRPIDNYAVWRSDNGSSWTMVEAHPPYMHPTSAGTTRFSSTAYDDKLWVVIRDIVLWSQDGVSWTTATATAPWSPDYDTRRGLFVFDDRLWNNQSSATWSSTDGANWRLEAGFVEREGPNFFRSPTAVLGGRVWALEPVLTETTYRLWSSHNGTSWTLVQEALPFVGSWEHPYGGVQIPKLHLTAMDRHLCAVIPGPDRHMVVWRSQLIAPLIDSSSTQFTFPDQHIDAGPPSYQTLTITNASTATAELVIDSLTITGAGAAAYSIDVAPTSTTLAIGESTTLSVRFDPVSAGPRDASFLIANNDPEAELLLIALSGLGLLDGFVAPTNPGVVSATDTAITWSWLDNASIETGFPVYCGAGETAPNAALSTAPANATQWTTSSLTPNTRHAFQVAAVCDRGLSERTSTITAWTHAAVPAAPQVDPLTPNALRVTPGVDGNPSGTEFAVYCATTGLWLQADGSLGPGETWLTGESFDVLGLSVDTAYSFALKARNGAGVETALGAPAGGRTSKAMRYLRAY